MVYVIGDIHGCYDEFQQMLEVSNFDYVNDKMYFVGDYIDKGKDSYKMLRYIDKHTWDKCFFFLRGNHEDEFISYIDLLDSIESDKSKLELCEILHDRSEYFDMYGTVRQLLSMDRMGSGATLSRWANMFRRMPLHEYFSYNGIRYGIAHAGFTLNKAGKEFENFTLYAREEALKERGRRRSITIVGHTPTCVKGTFAFNYGNVFKHYNEERDYTFYDIDCGSCLRDKYKDAKLACIRLDDQEIFYV